MISNYKYSNLKFKKLKISDYQKFKKLFYLCFKKKISYEFFKWRYFKEKSSFCYGVFDSTELVANVGMVLIKLNNNSNKKIYSRHSSMVLQNYRGKKIYSNLLNKVKKKITKKVDLVCMWPNNKNFSSFGIDRKKIVKRKYYLYKTFSVKKSTYQTKSYNINYLTRFKNFIQKNNSLFVKNFNYFKKRYLEYKKNEYLINKFEFREFKSFFIIKKNIDSFGLSYVVLDHFGSEEIKSKHLSCLISEQNKLIFLSKKKIQKPYLKLLNDQNFHIGFIKNFNLNKKKFFLSKKEIFLGDTDIFITI